MTRKVNGRSPGWPIVLKDPVGAKRAKVGLGRDPCPREENLVMKTKGNSAETMPTDS